MNDLLPCPFCGGKARAVMIIMLNSASPKIHAIACRTCGAQTRRYKREHDAIYRWNTRKDRPMNEALDKRSDAPSLP
jgi:Lar family restriction alleviation protein